MFLRVLLLVTLFCLAMSSIVEAQPVGSSSDSRILSSLQASEDFNKRDKRSPDPQWGYHSRPYYNNNNYYYGNGRGYESRGNFRRGIAAAAVVGGAAFGGALIGAGLARG